MNLFQILALVVVVGLLVLTLVAAVRGWFTRRETILLSALWLAAGVAIVWPGVTKAIANLLGIGRGADLLLYCSVVVMMVGFVMIYARLRRIRRELTLLVRHMAIRDATIKSPLSTPDDSSATTAPDDPSTAQ
jgi:hypothetical protein